MFNHINTSTDISNGTYLYNLEIVLYKNAYAKDTTLGTVPLV